MIQLTKEECLAFIHNECSKGWNAWKIASFQAQQDRLCFDFSTFHKAIEVCLQRPVYTHEFINQERICDELFKDKKSPTWEEMMSWIPDDKREKVFDQPF